MSYTEKLDLISNLFSFFFPYLPLCLSSFVNSCSSRGVEPNHSLLPSNELGVENHTKSKKKRKERTKEWKTPESGGLKDCKALQDKAEDQKPATDK